MLCLSFFLFQAVNNYSDFIGIFLFQSAIRWFINAAISQAATVVHWLHFLMMTYETSANEENINNRN